MPEIDGWLLVAPHPGQGLLLMGCIDPSVTDERDPLAVESSLDAIDLRNGFAEPPASSKYSAEFLQRYRAGQRARVARLDAIAKDIIATRLDARKKAKAGADEYLRRVGADTAIMTVWRTDADPRCFDLSIDPSDRAYGTLWSKDPRAPRFRRRGICPQLHPGSLVVDLVRPRANKRGFGETGAVDTAADAAGKYTGDASTFPSVAKEIFGAIGSSQKSHVRVRGDRHRARSDRRRGLGRAHSQPQDCGMVAPALFAMMQPGTGERRPCCSISSVPAPRGFILPTCSSRAIQSVPCACSSKNRANVTFGFGVVLSGRALQFLAEGSADVVERLKDKMEHWPNQYIVHRGQRVVVTGSSFSAIGRVTLLRELQKLCAEAGVELTFERRAPAAADVADCDVLVGADGANSAIRDSHADGFGTCVADFRNYFAWYGVERTFDAQTLTFRATEGGAFVGHHYRYTPAMSTFVAEVDTQSWDAPAWRKCPRTSAARSPRRLLPRPSVASR